MASSNSRFAVGYSNSTNFDDPSWPNIYYILAGVGISRLKAEVSTVEGQKPGTFDKYFAPHVGKDAVSITQSFVRPKDNPNGYVRLASKNHEDPPLIDPLYLKDRETMERIIDGKNIDYERIGIGIGFVGLVLVLMVQECF